ncbi:type II toxin-antitoxin system HicB family antitoxin [Desulforamulus aeronauticus]|uniref:Predicted nuclease of the RNAse H fold, HicB family n=1 Tax=Desulforamulus aeronauticus DSM 10349 TaxID=1121421 RepID=A0A1M6WT83_9FIRM|nr:type II toxin-antitoxin system HicB family antitoxin [Desulforamulus aeronauticus]SHK96851.1 Predicted nuclease of the RNAse H fold, HicB family [Desulforamulus aeronauticus DSM 10349]
MKKDRYIFPAIFDYADDGISIEFPDLPDCLPCAHSDEEAVSNTKEAMALHLYSMEQDGDQIPEPTPVTKLQPQRNQAVVLVDVWMPVYRSAIENKAVKKTLTIPKWLNDLAEQEKVNFSQILQEALKQNLGISNR